ncbi:hypothetical protein CALVIDRAFT_564290 [Calocera viscosa TUFC12733]|uniref:SLS1 second KH domain-containing protein n=1 Tax=Calocera viscosa (strain TUFC12733) TaxID=1330018 RepID=A0A167LTE9_CALVF|nr:hypothetical protein CALVIDRAFT_564290 [Calocera viscosa TUFC12733]
MRPNILLRPDHRRYPKFYEKTTELLTRSFTSLQLKKFMLQLGLLVPYGARKETIVRLLLHHWQIPLPAKKREDEDVELVERDFPLLPSELFLLMGTDGSDLLRLSHDFQARLTPIPNPLRLRAYGQPTQLDHLAWEIEGRRAKMMCRNVKLECAVGVRPDLIQTISRISGAFIENVGEAEVKITALDEESAEVARRLAERAGIEARDAVARPMLAHVTPISIAAEGARSESSTRNEYALYPFLVPGVLPWTMGYSNPYRVRRVGDGMGEDQRASSFSPRLAFGRWTSRDGTGVKTLREALLGGLPAVPLGFLRTVSATAGYHLVSAPGSQSLARVSLAAPIRDPFNFRTFLDWLAAGNGSTTFLPGVPSSIRAETLKPRRLAAVEDVLLYRLRYQAREESPTVPTKKSSSRPLPSADGVDRKDILDVQINFTMWEAHMPAERPAERPADIPATNTSSLFSNPLTKPSPYVSPVESEPKAQADNLDSLPSQPIPPRVMTARRGYASTLDVLLPDRQFDLRLSVLDSIRLTVNEIPENLEAHLQDCRRAFTDNDKLPESPFSVVLGNVTYDLASSEVVRISQREEGDVRRLFDGAAPRGQSAITVIEKVADRDILDQQALQCRARP